MHRMTFNEEVELTNLYNSISYEEINDRSATSGDTNLERAESTFVMVSEATVSAKAVSRKARSVQVQERTALPTCKEAGEAPLVNANHAFSEDFDEDMSAFKKTTQLSSKCYNVIVCLIQSKEVHNIVMAVLDTKAEPN